MSCTCSNIPSPKIDCTPWEFKPSDLSDLGYSDTQIKWIISDLKNILGDSFRIESIKSFPNNNPNGFRSKNGEIQPESKWKVCLSFENPYCNFHFLLSRN